MMGTVPARGQLSSVHDESLVREIYRQPEQLARKVRRWFDQAHRSTDPWRSDTIESFRFTGGDQFSDDELELRNSKGRPSLVINKILPRVLFLSGMYRQSREEPKILPQEQGDVTSSALMGALYKWVGQQSQEERVDVKVFDNKIISGLGFWKWSIDFSRDPTGDLRLGAPNPLSIFPDPNWLDNGWENAEYVIDAKWWTLEQALEEFPEHAQEIRSQYGEWLSEFTGSSRSRSGAGEFAGDSFSDERLFWDPETQRVRVLECWYKLRAKVKMAFNVRTQEITTDPARVKFFEEGIERQPEIGQEIRVFRRQVARVRVARILNDILLEDSPSPWKLQEFPIFPSVGFYFWRRPFGIVQPLKDVQREKNVRRSTMIDMVQRAALSGFFNDRRNGAETEELEKYMAGVGKIINHRGAAPVLITPPELPQSLVFLDTASDRDMDAISNINSDLLGISTQRTVSGRAIRARQQAGAVVQEPMLGSMVMDKEAVVRFGIAGIQQFMPIFKAVRILGAEAVRSEGGEVSVFMAENNFVDVQRALSAMFDARFDVAIGTKPFEPSMQQQKLTVLTDLAQEFPGYIPPKVVVEQLVKAGIVDEQHGLEILAFIQGQLEQQQQAQAAATAGRAPAPPASPLLQAA